MRKPRIYIAGPMRSLPQFNFPAFMAAEELLRPEYITFNPALEDLKRGFDARGLDGTEDLDALGLDMRKVLEMDLTWIARHAEGIALLDGWEFSLGVAAEVALANALKIPVKLVGDWARNKHLLGV